MSEYFIDSVLKWVKCNSTPYEVMWLNHKRLHVQGFNTRTTSVGEGMHFSMKNGVDGMKDNHQPDGEPRTNKNKLFTKCRDNGEDSKIYQSHWTEHCAYQKHKKCKKYTENDRSKAKGRGHHNPLKVSSTPQELTFTTEEL